ncbi:MAG: cytochrome c oxidase accessory protein CcoG [Pseudomonadota bacterium]
MLAKDDMPDVEKFLVEPTNSKAHRELYVAREKIHPKRAEGFYRSLKWVVMFVTLGIYYVTPWLRWDRGLYAPDQAVLVDLANARFYFFFVEIWPQEFFFVAGLLVMAGIGLFLITSTVGRAWCGYTCPQTVWVDLFLVVERAVEGDRNARIKLDAAPMLRDKLIKRITKHTLWLLIAVATGGAWIFYFADAPTLLGDFVTGQAVFAAYATVVVLTFTTYTFGGLLREQVCTYMCPWPRIQAAMLDEHSLTVTYNDWRGEPRSRHTKRALQEGKKIGDCVDCNACVAVCPMGIDIRDGQQLECITCALCIDACNGVMEKLGRECGLISYTTLSDYDANMALAGASRVNRSGDMVWDTSDAQPIVGGRAGEDRTTSVVLTQMKSVIRPRTLVYLAIWSLCGMVLLGALFMRDRLDINVRHDRNPLYVRLSDGSIRNGYEVKILNMKARPRIFELRLANLQGGLMTLAGAPQSKSDKLIVSVKPDQLRQIKVFVTVPKNDLRAGRHKFEFRVNEIKGSETATYKAHFETPGT